jgi:hypothetical protein
MKKSVLLAILSIFYVFGFGQSIQITGSVVDATTKLPIDFANIRFSESNTGALTDSTGKFVMATNNRPFRIKISAIGYKTQVYTLPGKSLDNILIELKPTNIELQEVTIKPTKRRKREIDTTALYLLKQVQFYKQQNNSKGIATYKFHEHTKLIISLLNVPDKFVNSRAIKPFRFFFDFPDTTMSGKKFYPLLMQEEYNETFHRATPKVNRKVVYYRKTSGFKGNKISNLLAAQFEPIDLYDNVYLIAGKAFTSPFSPGAQLTYTYHILDTIRTDTSATYVLNFVARNKTDVAIKGSAEIDSATWGIRGIEFRPNQNSNLNFLTDYSIHQEFAPIDGRWLLRKETVSAVGNLLEKSNRFSVFVTKYTERDSIYTDFTIPDSLSKKKDDILVKNYWNHPYTFLDSLRFTPLDSSEIHVYKALDSANHVRAFRAIKWTGNLLATGNLRAGPVEFGKVYQFVSRNAVEGYRVKLAVRTNEYFSRVVWLYGHVAYGFQDKRVKYHVEGRFMLPAKYDRWHAIGLRLKDDMVMPGQTNPLLTFDNILTLLSGKRQVIRAQSAGIDYERDWFKGLSSTLSFHRTNYLSMPQFYTFQTQGTDGIRKDLSKFYTNELSAELRYCKTEKYIFYYGYRRFIPSKTPSFSFKYTLGLGNIITNGGYNYHKFEAEIKHLLYMRVAGYAYISLNGGYMLGQVPYPAAYVAPNNLSIFRDRLSYQLTMPFEFVNDKYVSLWYEHHFEGLLFNHIPWVKRAKLREMVTVKALWGGYSDANRNLVIPFINSTSASTVPYVEVGFGIENILKVAQVSFVWRATHRDTPGGQNFGVKIAIVPSF